MGYRYISRSEIAAECGDDTRKCILRKTAAKKLMELNEYERNGETYKFSEKDIAEDFFSETFSRISFPEN
jgi:hypothetical protein